MKIAYCLNSICTRGGMEMVTIVKANALAAMPENEVYIIVTDNKGVPMSPLSPKVHLIDLQIDYYADDWKSKWHVLKGIFIKRREHKRRLTQMLAQIWPDIVISVGQAEKYMIPDIQGKWKTIRELHFCKPFRSLDADTVIKKMIAWISNVYDFHWKIWQYDKIVLLTHDDKELYWPNDHRLEVIPNPVTFSVDKTSALNAKKVMAAGRLERPKNFASLIRAFRYVVEKHPDWTLDIYGEGSQKAMLQQQIEQAGLAGNIFLRGYSSEVREKMMNASIFVLSSLFEGFALVVVEAMACGLPVVSYTCPCGPKDIITDGKDGFLVPVNDEKALADNICKLIEDEALRKRMGEAAKAKSEKYNITEIMQMWTDLFHRMSR